MGRYVTVCRIAAVSNLNNNKAAVTPMRAYQVLFCSALALSAGAAMAQTTVAGSTPGQFSVSDAGAATYRIPIQVPPGVAGMEPKLEMVYNSHAGNSIVGMGWGLAGLSAITRCPRTTGSDGARGTVTLANTDRFCLDGQRLLLTSGSTYGASGTEYRTERESFAKITATGGDNGGSGTYSGPTSFTVKTKAGLTLDFGVTADARILAPSKPAVLAWALNKVTDIKGNYQTVSYLATPADGTVYPSRIDYSGNAAAGKLPGMSVRFSYAARTDKRPYYVGGAVVQVQQGLSNVKTFVAESMVKDYRLSYSTNGNLANSTLSTLTECIDPNTCLAAKTFEHTSITNVLAVGTVSGGDIDFGSGHVWKDSNGDGKADFCRNDINSHVSCNLSTGANFGATLVFDPNSMLKTWVGTVGPDLNGDGILDYCGTMTESTGGPEAIETSYGRCYLSNGSGGMLAVFDSPATPVSVAVSPQAWVDANGDGRDDLCGLNPIYTYSGPEVETVTWRPACVYSNGTSWGNSLIGDVMPASSGSMKWIDVNGDGMADFCLFTSAAVPQCSLSIGASVFGATLTGAAVPTAQLEGRDWADFNGDGKIEYCYVLNSTQLQCRINTGTAFVGDITSGTLDLGVAASRVWVDVNGDSKADFCRQHSDNRVSCTLSTGDGFGSTVTSGALAYSSGPEKWVDVNGDGFLDYCRRIANHMECLTSTFMDSRIDKIIDGTGAYVEIGYQSIAVVSPSAIYSADVVPAYPLVNRQIPAHVVASVLTSNAIGGVVTTNYTYGGLKEELASGRGMLGFRWVNAKNTTTLIESYTEYQQDWPFVGMVKKSEMKRVGSGNAGVLRRITATFACKVPQTGASCVVAAGNRYFPHEVIRYEESWDLNGAVFPSVSTATTHNINAPDSELRGDPSVVTVTSTLGSLVSTRTSTNQYEAADTTAWALGRLKRQTVISTVPDAGPVSNNEWTPWLVLNATPASQSIERPSSGTATTTATAWGSGGTGPYTYAWTRVLGSRTAMTNATSATPTFTASVAVGENFTETMRVTMTDGAGTSTFKEITVQYWAPAALTATLTRSPSSYSVGCGFFQFAPTSTIAASGGSPPYQYTWLVTPSGNSSNGFQSVTSSGTSATILINQYATDETYGTAFTGQKIYNYQVRVTDSQGTIVTPATNFVVNVSCAANPQNGLAPAETPPYVAPVRSAMSPLGGAKV